MIHCLSFMRLSKEYPWYEWLPASDDSRMDSRRTPNHTQSAAEAGQGFEREILYRGGGYISVASDQRALRLFKK